MNCRKVRVHRSRGVIRLIVGLLGAVIGGHGLKAATQVVPFNPGWNAIWLRVAPSAESNSPGALWSATSIKTAAMFVPRISATEFLLNPEEARWNEAGWATWFAPDQPAAFLTSLFSVQGERAVLIKAKSAGSFTVMGRERLHRFIWRANSFNFTGFPVDPAAPPTFGAFFVGSAAHQDLRVFGLEAGLWRQLAANTPIVAGQAYWVWCRGGSNYQGALGIEAPGNALSFSALLPGQQLALQNLGATSAVVTIQLSGALPLAYQRGTREGGKVPLITDFNAPLSFSLASGAEETITFLLRSERLGTGVPASDDIVMTIKDGRGGLWTLPVRYTSQP